MTFRDSTQVTLPPADSLMPIPLWAEFMAGNVSTRDGLNGLDAMTNWVHERGQMYLRAMSAEFPRKTEF